MEGQRGYKNRTLKKIKMKGVFKLIDNYILNQDQIINIYLNLIPSLWYKATRLSPVERAKGFFLPGCNDVATVKLAKDSGINYIMGKENLADARLKFRQAGGIKVNSENYNLSIDFYSSLIHSAARYLFACDPDVIEAIPNFEISGKFDCCKLCKNLRGKIFKKLSPEARTLYSPWHFGCKNYVSELTDKECNYKYDSFEIINKDDYEDYFCNPVDLLVAADIIEDFSGIINTKSS